ncbi:hypothetical protein llap_9134 [Limosa lapponica baueri]|uniref:Uncharacterized protein n=1 Tax=Limosa lapponica baueri TaxID=1758121 RepID=A0A2I0U3E1_LIMLA|nr:hypothetical protein llap_9134 [Limosa lapponica baueri]
MVSKWELNGQIYFRGKFFVCFTPQKKGEVSYTEDELILSTMCEGTSLKESKFPEENKDRLSHSPKHLLCLQVFQIPSRQIAQPSAIIPEKHTTSGSPGGTFQIICCESKYRNDPLPLTGIFDKSHLGKKPEPREVSKGYVEAMVTPRMEGWKNAFAPPSGLQIQNRFSTLGTGEDKQDLSGDLSELTEPSLLSTQKERGK